MSYMRSGIFLTEFQPGLQYVRIVVWDVSSIRLYPGSINDLD
jgi:hypothetical protein